MVKSSALSCLQVDHGLNPPWLFISKRTQAYFSGQLESLSASLTRKTPNSNFWFCGNIWRVHSALPVWKGLVA
jgi:hypothetical protein